MATARKTDRRRPLLLIGLITLFLLGLAFFLFLLTHGSPLVSSPTEVRSWAEERYQIHFDPGSYKPLPTLKTSPTPTITPIPTEDLSSDRKIGFRITAPHYTDDEHHERFVADKKGQVVLPDGNTLRIAGIAVLFPTDIDWEKRTPDVPLDWCDPFTGESLPPEMTKDWKQAGRCQKSSPSLFIHIERQGQRDLIWRYADLFDAATKVSISNTASHSPQGGHGQFENNLTIRHSTPVTIGIGFAFGPSETQSLLMKPGEIARFGDDAEVQVLGVVPGGINAHSSSVNSHDSSVTFGRSGPKLDTDGVVVSAWPREGSSLLRINLGSTDRPRWQGFSSQTGISRLTMDRQDQPVEGTLVRYSRLGRAIFEIPSIPRLPKVTNLFDTPIPEVTFKNQWQFTNFIGSTTELDISLGAKVPETLFPMTQRDTTPRQLLKQYEAHLGHPVFYSRDQHRLKDKDTKVSGWAKWWGKVRPSWWP